MEHEAKPKPVAVGTAAQLPAPSSLDDWYKTLRGIYFDRNYYRSAESLMCHLVEVVGGLSIVVSGKKRSKVNAEAFLAKSFGWWLTLCAHVGLPSIETVVWHKFPNVCTYCHRREHDEGECRRRRRRSGGHPEWTELARLADENKAAMPTTLTEWQTMFQRIYRRDASTAHEKNFSRLTEELGELAEAVRSLPLTRSYFLSEASDVFAWLMGVANQLRVDASLMDEPTYDWDATTDPLGRLVWMQYPGKCKYCGSPSCKCPPFPRATRGRIVHEGPPASLPHQGEPFTTAEKLAFLDMGEEFITVGGHEYRADSRLVEEAVTMLARIDEWIKEKATADDRLVRAIDSVVGQLEILSDEQVLTQDRVTLVLDEFENLPGPVANSLLQYVTGIGSGLWVEWIRMRLGLG